MKKLCGYRLPKYMLTKIARLKGKSKYEPVYMRLLRRYVRKLCLATPTFKATKISTTRMVGKYIVYISYWRGLVGMGWVKYDNTQDYYSQLAEAQKIAISKTNYPK